MPFGPVTSWSYGGSLSHSRNYNQGYQISSIVSSGVQSLSYSYHANGNISSMNNAIRSQDNQSFTYDNRGRLTAIARPGQATRTITYDVNGNRTGLGGATQDSYTYSANSDRLLTVTRGSQTREFTYDANGNVTQEKDFNGQTRNYTYNASNRMSAAGTASYSYNALGQRVRKQIGSQATHFIYSPDGALLAEGTTTQYIYFAGMVVGLIRNNQLYYVMNDHLGRPEVITNTSGQVVWRAQLNAFDRTVLMSSIGDFNIGFPGQYWDSEKGNWYNYFRDYDSKTGRYLQSDPIGLEGGLNTYVYGLSNPLTFVDRYGLLVDLCSILKSLPSNLLGTLSAGYGSGLGGSFTATVSRDRVSLDIFGGLAGGVKGSWQPETANISGYLSREWGETNRRFNVGTRLEYSYGKGLMATGSANFGTNGVSVALEPKAGSGIFGGVGFTGSAVLIDCREIMKIEECKG